MRSHPQMSFADTEAEIGNAVNFVVHIERKCGRRTVSEVVSIRGYDRDAKQFLIDSLFGSQSAEESALQWLPQPTPVFTMQRRTDMPLIEVTQSRQISASVRLDEATAAQVDQYAAFIHASADDVVDKALNYVFSKDRDFQEFLKSAEARVVPTALRIRKTPSIETPMQSVKRPVVGVESNESVRVQRA